MFSIMPHLTKKICLDLHIFTGVRNRKKWETLLLEIIENFYRETLSLLLKGGNFVNMFWFLL